MQPKAPRLCVCRQLFSPPITYSCVHFLCTTRTAPKCSLAKPPKRNFCPFLPTPSHELCRAIDIDNVHHQTAHLAQQMDSKHRHATHLRHPNRATNPNLLFISIVPPGSGMSTPGSSFFLTDKNPLSFSEMNMLLNRDRRKKHVPGVRHT